MVWACSIVACLGSIPRTAATSCVTWALDYVSSPVTIVVGRYVCLHYMFIITRSTTLAVMRATGWKNKYLENTSVAVFVWPYPPLGAKFGRISICRMSSSPKFPSGQLMRSLLIRLDCIQVWHSLAHFLMY